MKVNSINFNYLRQTYRKENNSAKNYSEYPCRNNSKLNFGNGFNKPLSQKAIFMLGQNIINIIPCSELNEVNKIMPYMVKRQQTLYPQSKSIEMFKLADKDLEKFLEKSGGKLYNLPFFEGIGIAIGDSGKFIENWNKAYETLVCLVPRVNAEEYKYKVFARNIGNM